jgi:hypothetical protein
MEIGMGLRKKKKNPNLPEEDNSAKNAQINKNIDETFFKKPEPDKPVVGGGSYSEKVDKQVAAGSDKVEAELELRNLMGIPPENTAMLDKKQIKSWLKSAGVDTGGINFDNYAEVVSVYHRSVGNSAKDPRSV